MPEPQVAYPNPEEKCSPLVWAHDHQPGMECFGARSAGLPRFCLKGLGGQSSLQFRRHLTGFEDLNSRRSSRKW